MKIQILFNDASFTVLEKLDWLWTLDANPLNFFFFAFYVYFIWNFMDIYEQNFLKTMKLDFFSFS